MPQVCSSFDASVVDEVERIAATTQSTKSKVITMLVTKALGLDEDYQHMQDEVERLSQQVQDLEAELKIKDEQLGLSLSNQQRLTVEIAEPLKLLMAPKKRWWQFSPSTPRKTDKP